MGHMFSCVIDAVLGEGGLSISDCSKARYPEQARNSAKKLAKDHPSVLSTKSMLQACERS